MILRKISLAHFRNYKSLSLSLSPNTNIFIGNNAQGKTNILESIYILAITKSHRIGLDNNLIQTEYEAARIKGVIKQDKIIKDLEVTISKMGKKVKINNTEIRKIADYISNLNVILFTPDDLEIIKGSPAVRRNLLNIEISQVSSNYLEAQNTYNKILKMRNEYLKNLSSHNGEKDIYFDVITDKLVEQAVIIYQYRNQFIDKINKEITDIYRIITTISGLHIEYQTNLELCDFTPDEITSKLKNKFQINYRRELSQGTTLYGPHRDDFSFFIDEMELKFYGSQGQQRLAVISFKLAEIPIFKEYTGTSPVLLLDDIFSEIDKGKKNRLLKYLNDDIQTIITTTDLKDVNKKIVDRSTIFKVVSGNIEKEGK